MHYVISDYWMMCGVLGWCEKKRMKIETAGAAGFLYSVWFVGVAGGFSLGVTLKVRI